MKQPKWFRLLCLALAILVMAGTVLSAVAANFVNDIDGDGKITAFDAQLIAESNAGQRELSPQQQAAAKDTFIQNIMDFLLGKDPVDIGDLNNDGVLEIYTVKGLENLYTQPEGQYILMDDLDLQGADWIPVAGFSGSFDGNGNTISNFTINTSVADSVSSGIYNQAFFGDTMADSTISDLHFENVTVTAAADTTAMGMFIGCQRGALTDCTATGTIVDTREEYPANMYVGVFTGRMLYGYEASITGGTAISFTDEYGRKTTKNLCANVAILIENETVNLGSANPDKIGLAGYADNSHTVTGNWLDMSNSTTLLSQTMQDRKQKVVDYMNTMATVEWTPTETLYYTAANGTDQTIVAGKVHIGLPYNFHNGSYERFLSSMDTQDENGVWTANADLESCGWDNTQIVKYYLRPYITSTAEFGVGIHRTKLVRDEYVKFDSNGYLYFSADDVTYYFGSDENSEHIHAIGYTANAQCAQLYDVSGDTPVPVTNPVENTVYKLATKDANGVIWYFNGSANYLNGVNSLIATKVLADAEDVYLEVKEDGFYLCHDEEGEWSETGFYLTMGNACNTSVSWAWKTVSSVFANDGSRKSNFGYEGGFIQRGAQGMIPTDYNRETYGMYPVGDWQATATDENGKIVSAEWDASEAAYAVSDQIYSPQVLNDNGLDTMYEAYAQSHKGDGLVCYVAHWTTGNPGPGGHVRMITSDPIVIRDAYGVIDGKASYLCETEQGVGFNRNNHDFPTSWAYAEAHSFYDLLGKPATMPTELSTKTYLPMTIRALQEEYQPEIFVSEITNSSVDGKIPEISPTTGLIYSSHSITSITLTILNGSGTVLYQHEAFTGVSSDSAVFGDTQYNRFYMADLHAEAFYEAAEGLLRNGRSYKCHVDINLATGETIRLVEDRAFTYTPAE